MDIITNFLKDMDIISALNDQPNDVGGLTAAELKAKFDEGGKAIQEYINHTLIPEILGLEATESQRQSNEAQRIAAEAERATIPVVKGIYNCILSDCVTGERYTLIVNWNYWVLKIRWTQRNLC